CRAVLDRAGAVRGRGPVAVLRRVGATVTALPEPGQQSWRGLRVVVAGLGIAGFACADALLQREADVVVIDDNDGPEQVNKAQILEVLGATVLLGDASV